jgi:hypothetical protein
MGQISFRLGETELYLFVEKIHVKKKSRNEVDESLINTKNIAVPLRTWLLVTFIWSFVVFTILLASFTLCLMAIYGYSSINTQSTFVSCLVLLIKSFSRDWNLSIVNLGIN